MLAAEIAPVATGYGAYLLQTTLALLAVCALAALTLRLMRRRGIGRARGLRVVSRLSLEPRRSVYVIEAAGKCLLVGVGDGPMAVLAELDPAEVARIEAEDAAGEGAGLVDVMRRALFGRAK
jgi:flagellar biosynthetic protein FliO